MQEDRLAFQKDLVQKGNKIRLQAISNVDGLTEIGKKIAIQGQTYIRIMACAGTRGAERLPVRRQRAEPAPLISFECR